MGQNRYEYIDSLRGIAILMVITVHILTFFVADTSAYLPQLAIDFILNMKSCVSLFFIVSAFTLTMSHEKRRTETHATTKFFIRRFFRVAPAYYLAILIITVYTIYLYPNFVNAIPSFWFVGNLLFLNTLFPSIIGTIVPGGWSVSVEFLFYMLFPLFTYLIRNANSCIFMFGITATIATLFHFNYVDDPVLSLFHYMDLNFIYQLPAFFMGILAYYIIKDGIKSINHYSLFIIMYLCVLFTNFPMPYYILWSVAFMLLILILHRKTYKLFSNKILSKVGEVSFSMYIIHFLVIIIMNKLHIGQVIPVSGAVSSFANFILLYLIVSIISFAIANLTYRLIEIPGQNLGRKLIKKLDQQNNITV